MVQLFPVQLWEYYTGGHLAEVMVCCLVHNWGDRQLVHTFSTVASNLPLRVAHDCWQAPWQCAAEL